MAKSDNIIKFEDALKNDELKRKTFDDAYKKILAEKSAGSNGEALVKAAKEIGFDISIEELERSYAEKQEMNDEELDKVAGGGRYCEWSYYCITVYSHEEAVDDLPDCIMDYHLNCFEDYHDPFVKQANQ